MKNITNMTVEAYKNMSKTAKKLGWQNTAKKYIKKVNDIIVANANDVKVIFSK